MSLCRDALRAFILNEKSLGVKYSTLTVKVAHRGLQSVTGESAGCKESPTRRSRPTGDVLFSYRPTAVFPVQSL